MAFYESIYILRPDLTTEEVEQINNRVAEIIASQGGKILETELWGRRQLAYLVKKTNKGFYVFHVVEGGGPLVATLESWLKINEDVLKYQTISVRKPKTGPSPLVPFEDKRPEGEAPESLLETDEEEAAAAINAFENV
ncbi:MAG: 30S ribosomal protein S6 [Magnetococcales bacterium]|nr:30S ribosomal protein S6 [Magnetococcales bacterium]MBF0583706.1 30S ribosomal protein S6 [Magnetococcales bacterium]